jgi:hypothetical protein
VNVPVFSVGRPGLDPGTLGIEPGHLTASAVVPITWSERSITPPTSTEIPSNLISWLHNWLYSIANDAFGDVEIRGVDGLDIEVHIKRPNL